MAFISLTPQALTRNNPKSNQEKIGLNTANIVDLKPDNNGGIVIYTIAGIRTVEESYDEVMAKCSE